MGSQYLISGRLLLISICWWYGIDEVLKEIEELLKLFLLEGVDLLLMMLQSTFLSIVDGV